MIATKRVQYAMNINTGVSSAIAGSDASAPNNGILRNVSGLSFSNTIVRSFVATVTVSIVRSSEGNLFETFTLEGIQKASSWELVISSVGDNTQTTFSITSSGQVQHTTAVFANWTSTTIRYSANQMSITGQATGLTQTTTGSHNFGSLQISDTTDSISEVNNGNIHMFGGATIEKSLNVKQNITVANVRVTNNMNVVGSLTAGNLTIPGTLTITNITVQNLLQTSGTMNITGNTNTIGNIFTTGGNVGIATTSPQSMFHINGSVGSMPIAPTASGILMGTDITAYSVIQLNSTAGSYIDFSTPGIDYQARISYDNNQMKLISQPSVLAMTLGSTGNVGIGTTTPSGSLHIRGSGVPLNVQQTAIGNNIIARMTGNGGSGNSYFIDTGAYFNGTCGTARISFLDDAFSSNIQFSTKQPGSENTTLNPRLTIASDGKIGIGTTAPSSQLDVITSNTFANIYLGNTLQNRKLVLWSDANNDHQYYGLGINSGILRFQVPIGGVFRFSRGDNSTTSSEVVSINTNSRSMLIVRDPNGFYRSDWPFEWWTGGTSTHDITCAGVYYNGLTQRSDIRKKKDIVNYTRGLNEVMQMRPVSFKWKEANNDPNTQYGFIAQEIEQVIPEIVGEDTLGFKNIKDAFNPILVNAVKDIKTKLDNTKTQLETVLLRIAQLKSRQTVN